MRSRFLPPSPSRAAPKPTCSWPPNCLRARNKGEQNLIDSFLQTFDLAVPDQTDGMAALDLYRQFRLSHGVDRPDCQIAATALRLGVEVFTQNVKHFTAFPGLRVVRAY